MEIAWHAQFPTPSFDTRRVEPAYLISLIRNPQLRAGIDYIVVDVRRLDFEVIVLDHWIQGG